jgi:two-component system, chemotaxis family, protein-glutamate methylesterase/glutaminase
MLFGSRNQNRSVEASVITLFPGRKGWRDLPIRVLVVDDSVLIRQVLSDILENEPDISVVGTASDGEDALHKIKLLQPDVITLDIEMPKMNGLECLVKIMEHTPLPVIMVSYLTTEGAEVTLKALECGAIDFVTKPTSEEPDTNATSLDNIKYDLIQKIRMASEVKLANIAPGAKCQVFEKPKLFPVQKRSNFELLAIGASTGGPKALYYLLAQFPKNFPLGVIIAQHMPKGFTDFFARRLNDYCQLEVTEAKTGDEIKPGRVLIAPSGYQTKLRRIGESLVVEVSEEPKFILKPSVNYLFDSIAEACGDKVLGVLLTGMGVDGGLGMQHLRQLGARTIAQDEKSCIVYGMPRAAVEMGGAEFIDSLLGIYGRISHLINE